MFVKLISQNINWLRCHIKTIQIKNIQIHRFQLTFLSAAAVIGFRSYIHIGWLYLSFKLSINYYWWCNWARAKSYCQCQNYQSLYLRPDQRVWVHPIMYRLTHYHKVFIHIKFLKENIFSVWSKQNMNLT